MGAVPFLKVQKGQNPGIRKLCKKRTKSTKGGKRTTSDTSDTSEKTPHHPPPPFHHPPPPKKSKEEENWNNNKQLFVIKHHEVVHKKTKAMNIKTRVPDSFSLADAAQNNGDLAIAFVPGDLLIVGANKAFEVTAAKISRGPEERDTAVLRFSNPAGSGLERQQWWALGWDSAATRDEASFIFTPVSTGDSSVVTGSFDGPFAYVRVVPLEAVDRTSELNRSVSRMNSNDSTMLKRFLEERLSPKDIRKMGKRQAAVDSQKDNPALTISSLLWLLGTRRFEHLLTSGKGPSMGYLSQKLGGTIECASAQGQPRHLVISLRIQGPEDLVDMRSSFMKVTLEYKTPSLSNFEEGVREVDLLSSADTACPVDDPMAMFSSDIMLAPVSQIYLTFPELDPSAPDDDEELGAPEALLLGARVTSRVVARAVWRALPVSQRKEVWIDLAQQDSAVGATMEAQVKARVQENQHGHTLRDAEKAWRTLSVFHRLALVIDNHRSDSPDLPLGLRSLAAFVSRRNLLKNPEVDDLKDAQEKLERGLRQ
jgi:hypothetical protein